MRQPVHYHSTDTLAAEHQAVLRTLDTLEKYSKLWGTGNGTSDAEAKTALEEVLEFFDQELELHLKKEEVALFPAMETVVGKDGPTFVMLMEHDDLRKYVAKLNELVPTLDGPDAEKAKQVQRTGDYICRLLRGHIEKEDTILFPMANQVVSPAEMAKVDDQVRELDAERK